MLQWLVQKSADTAIIVCSWLQHHVARLMVGVSRICACDCAPAAYSCLEIRPLQLPCAPFGLVGQCGLLTRIPVCRVDCCLYAVNMGYHSSVGNTTAAVTTDNSSAIAIACPTTAPVQWQTADLAVTTAASPGAGNVTIIYDVTSTGSNDTTYVAKVVLEPSYEV